MLCSTPASPQTDRCEMTRVEVREHSGAWRARRTLTRYWKWPQVGTPMAATARTRAARRSFDA